ncbi:MAG: hypothetical protein ACYSX0_17290 [Planctomycetota bacterium]|jgi:hypothetical protein
MEGTHGRRGWLGPWIAALLVTLVLSVLIAIVSELVPSYWSGLIVVGSSSIWAAWDSSRIGLHRYKSQMANEPVVVLFMCVVFWLLCFPWYVIIRQGIKRGLVPLKQP